MYCSYYASIASLSAQYIVVVVVLWSKHNGNFIWLTEFERNAWVSIALLFHINSRLQYGRLKGQKEFSRFRLQKEDSISPMRAMRLNETLPRT